MEEEKERKEITSTIGQGFIRLFTEKEPRMEEQTIRILMKQEGITRERAKEITGYKGIERL
ncbi:hypothetical protein ES703_16283 [subsurface metagenome]